MSHHGTKKDERQWWRWCLSQNGPKLKPSTSTKNHYCVPQEKSFLFFFYNVQDVCWPDVFYRSSLDITQVVKDKKAPERIRPQPKTLGWAFQLGETCQTFLLVEGNIAEVHLLSKRTSERCAQ